MFYLIVQALALLGFVCGVLMFWSMKKPSIKRVSGSLSSVSIIIPARNEALRLPPLLQSLQAQSWQQFEVIVVDDGSTDETSAVATSYSARVLQSEQVGHMSPGKANACAYGARFATGDCLLFLDADVQFEASNSLERIVTSFYMQQKGILSIQPYHRIVKLYENLSVIFNVTMITGMNVFTIWRDTFHTAGSFGPCIVCDRASYEATGGHGAAAESIMDDFALSDVFLANDLPVTNYLGKGLLTMRMYEEGPGQLVEGWTKNLATASRSTHRFVMLLVQLWILGVLMATAAPIIALFTASTVMFVCSIVMYVLYGMHVYTLARKVGNFHALVIIGYPVFILFFVAIFMYSLFRTHVLRSVMWKGRKINV